MEGARILGYHRFEYPSLEGNIITSSRHRILGFSRCLVDPSEKRLPLVSSGPVSRSFLLESQRKSHDILCEEVVNRIH